MEYRHKIDSSEAINRVFNSQVLQKHKTHEQNRKLLSDIEKTLIQKFSDLKTTEENQKKVENSFKTQLSQITKYKK